MHFITITSKKSWPKNVNSIIIYSLSCRPKPVWRTLPCNTKWDGRFTAPVTFKKGGKIVTETVILPSFVLHGRKSVSHMGLEWYGVSKWWLLEGTFSFYVSCFSDCILKKIIFISPLLFPPNVSEFSSMSETVLRFNQKSHHSVSIIQYHSV